MNFRTIAVAGVICLVAGCGKKPEELGGQSSATASDKDNKFITSITEANMVEIKAGEMAERSSSNDAVKDYGKMIVSDHQDAEKLVETTAKTIGAKVPTELDTDQKAMLDDLKNKTGNPFDSAFAKYQVDAHEKTIKAINDEMANGTNADVKKLAGDLLKKMQVHYDHAKLLKDSVDKFESTTKPM